MGFKAGQGLGKDAAGTKEPLDVRVKGGRKGLGVEEEKIRKDREEISRLVPSSRSLAPSLPSSILLVF
jgi:hypothetical protein